MSTLKLIFLLGLISIQSLAAEVKPYLPQEALNDIITGGQLKFVGKALMPGYMSIKSCLYKNDKVLILNAYCRKRELSVGSVRVYSFEKNAFVHFYAETLDIDENGYGTPISKAKREQYADIYGGWYIETRENLKGISLKSTVGKFKSAFGSSERKPYCVHSVRVSTCSEKLNYLAKKWLPNIPEFHLQPSQDWYVVLTTLAELSVIYGD